MLILGDYNLSDTSDSDDDAAEFIYVGDESVQGDVDEQYSNSAAASVEIEEGRDVALVKNTLV